MGFARLESLRVARILASNLAHMPVKRLIVNADDFGFNREITDGIVESHHNGVVTSTTLMINMPAAEYAVGRVKDCPEMSVGLHVNLTEGRPISDPGEIPSLVDAEGSFIDRPTFFKRANLCQLDSSHLRLEMKRQFEKIIELGHTPTHADSHHHSASCVQPFFIKLSLMKEFGIKRLRTHRGWYHRDRLVKGLPASLWRTFTTNIRRGPFRVYYELQHVFCMLRGISTPSERFGFFKVVSDRKMDFSMASVPSLVGAMPSGTSELCCHPGFHSDDPNDDEVMRNSRPAELKFLTDPAFRQALEEANIELVNYRTV